MKNRTIYMLTAVVCLLVLAVSAALAQTNVVVVPDNPVPSTFDVKKLWELGISIVAPAIVMGIKYLAPKIPTVLLPLSTPLIGIGLGLATNFLASSAHLGWVDMAQAGALAVFIRESWDQTLKALKTSS